MPLTNEKAGRIPLAGIISTIEIYLPGNVTRPARSEVCLASTGVESYRVRPGQPSRHSLILNFRWLRKAFICHSIKSLSFIFSMFFGQNGKWNMENRDWWDNRKTNSQTKYYRAGWWQAAVHTKCGKHPAGGWLASLLFMEPVKQLSSPADNWLTKI